MAQDYIDLLGLMERYYSDKNEISTIPKVLLQGMITRVMETPKNFLSNVIVSTTGKFVEMDIYSVKLTSIKSYLDRIGVENTDDTFMVNGRVLLFIDEADVKFNTFYETEVTLRTGARKNKFFFIGYSFTKQNDTFYILPNKLYYLNTSKWDTNSVMYQNMCKSKTEGRLIRTDIVLSLPQFYAEDVLSEYKIDNNQGVSNTDNKSGYETLVYGKPLVPESRIEVLDYSEIAKNLTGILDKAKTDKQKYLDNLIIQYKKTDRTNEYIKYLTDSIKMYLKNKPVANAVTGRYLLGKYLDRFKKSKNKYLGITVKEYLINNFDLIVDFITYGATVPFDGDCWDVCKSAFGNPEKMYANMLGQIVGVSVDELEKIELLCNIKDISFSQLVNTNPYVLSVISNLKFSDIEHIAMCLGLTDKFSLDKDRKIAMLHSYITSTDVNNFSTVFVKNLLKKSEIGVIISSSKFQKMKQTGTYLTVATSENIRYYLYLYRGVLGYDSSSFKVKGTNYIQAISGLDLDTIVNDYVSTGLGVEYQNFITSSTLLEKELYVYDKLHKLASKTNNYDLKLIEQYIDEYENIVGFKLEKEQRQAVYLLLHNAGVVSGSAGSGKTTVSNCLVYVLEKLDPLVSIQFSAPTGKACKRMQEVVKRPVKTFNSRFKIGIGSESELDKEQVMQTSSGVVHFFDESAMVTIDLMYSVLKRIDTDSRVYLFGDFNQLPPIGKGLPFKNLLRFMPCVVLKVSKRAAEGSNITRNSDYINNNSYSTNWEDLVSGDDFFLLNCKEEGIATVVTDMVRFYLGQNKYDYNLGLPQIADLKPDDIQVVSPFSKPAYTWGTVRLNSVLQPIFNNTRGVANTIINKKPKSDNYSKFLLNDRVIHTNKNVYSMQWYASIENGECVKRYGFGACNGDVGKIVGYFHSDDITFSDEIDEMPEEFEYPELMRDDSSFTGWFVAVKYYDYTTESDYYILYRCEENTTNPLDTGKNLFGEDLDNLMLFYAGTVHKLQGSQAKVVICPLGEIKFRGFVTRNMMYTAFTRGEKLVIGVGSVSNSENSSLTKARKDVAGEKTITIGELLC